MKYTVSQLKHFNLIPSEMDGLSADEQFEKIKKQYHKLSRISHPDKNPDQSATNKFIAMAAEYAIICDLMSKDYQPEINAWFKPEAVVIPDSAFDLLLQENILAAYADLIKTFSTLKTDHEKQAFGSRYAPFLNLAQALEKQADDLNRQRANYLFDQQNETLSSRLTREWRVLIVRLFAEEYLDDFQYRHALATGDLIPILATHKLLSPVKILVAILNSIILVIVSSASYFYHQLLMSIMKDWMAQYTAYQSGKLDAKAVGLFALKLAGFIFALAYAASFTGPLAMILPFVDTILEHIASPVNNIIRPIAAYTGLSTSWLSTLLAVTGAAALYALTTTAMLANMTTLLMIVTWYLEIDALYSFIKLVQKIYELSPATALIIGILMAGSSLMGLAIPDDPVDISQPVALLIDFIGMLFIRSSLRLANKQLDDPGLAQCELMEVLPLPKIPVPDSIKHAVLLGHKKATLSHRYFNTPADAKCMKPEERTIWQQLASFFGADEENDRNAAVEQSRLALCPG